MSRLISRTIMLGEAQRLHDNRRYRVHPNAQLEALARFCKFASAVVAFALVLAAILAIDVAIWVPHVRP